MGTDKKYQRLLIAAVRAAGGSAEYWGRTSLRIRVRGPKGVAYLGSRDLRHQNTVSYVRNRTGLNITF